MKISLRDPMSALTHYIALFMTMGGAIPLLIKAADISTSNFWSMLVFCCSMMALYAASGIYHSVILPPAKVKIFKKIDHSAIFLLIAGSYTPVCTIVLTPKFGLPMLIAIWSLALIGIIVKLAWIYCPKWFSSVIYIAMGWLCIFCIRPIVNSITQAAFMWLLFGGVIYTIGGIIYALKLPIFNSKHKYFGSHEIFHVFVMLGSFCHFIFMYAYVL